MGLANSSVLFLSSPHEVLAFDSDFRRRPSASTMDLEGPPTRVNQLLSRSFQAADSLFYLASGDPASTSGRCIACPALAFRARLRVPSCLATWTNKFQISQRPLTTQDRPRRDRECSEAAVCLLLSSPGAGTFVFCRWRHAISEHLGHDRRICKTAQTQIDSTDRGGAVDGESAQDTASWWDMANASNTR